MNKLLGVERNCRMGTGFCVRARHNGESFVPCDDYNITLLSTTQSGKKIAGMEITTDPTGFGQPKVLKGFKSHTYAYRYENRSIQEYSSTLPSNVIHLNSGHRGKKKQKQNKTKKKRKSEYIGLLWWFFGLSEWNGPDRICLSQKTGLVGDRALPGCGRRKTPRRNILMNITIEIQTKLLDIICLSI